MLNTVLFDMGGTLEDIWNNQETQAKAMDALQKTLRAHGLEPGCSPEEFDRRVMAGLKEYKRWSEGLELEKKPEEIWPDYYLKEFGFNREKLIPITEELANLWEVTYYHRELRGDVLETLEALKARGYHIGIISNNASLYNVFNMLEEYGIRGCMEDVTVSSVTGYRKPHPEIFRISLRQMQTTAENCVYVGDTISRDIIGAKQAGFGKAVQIVSALSAQKDAATAADAAVVGIGAIDQRRDATILRSGYISEGEQLMYARKGAVGDILGYFLQADGRPVEGLEIHRELLGVTLDELAQLPTIVGVAGGEEKAQAIYAALTGKRINGLVTEETTARAVLALAS